MENADVYILLKNTDEGLMVGVADCTEDEQLQAWLVPLAIAVAEVIRTQPDYLSSVYKSMPEANHQGNKTIN